MSNRNTEVVIVRDNLVLGSHHVCLCVFQTETKEGKGQMFVSVLVSNSMIQARCVSQDLQLCLIFFLVQGITAHVTPSSSHHPPH